MPLNFAATSCIGDSANVETIEIDKTNVLSGVLAARRAP
jgi:hypothetical protein